MSQFVYALFTWWAFGLFPVWGSISLVPAGPGVKLSVEGSGGTSRMYRHLFQVPCPSFHPAPRVLFSRTWHPLALWRFYVIPSRWSFLAIAVASQLDSQGVQQHSVSLTIHEYYRLAGFNQRTSFLTRLQAGKSGTKLQTNLVSSWPADGHHLVVSLQEKEKASSLMSVTL